VALATTHDFLTVERLGLVCPPEDKDAAVLPRRVGGDFILFHRPVSVIGGRPGVWMSRSCDLHGWAAPEPVFGARPGGGGTRPGSVSAHHRWKLRRGD